MICNRVASTTRLRVEQLESRDLLTADPFAAADLLPGNPQGSSDMSGGGFPGQVSAMAAASLGFINTGGTTVSVSGSNPNPTNVDPNSTAAIVPAGAPAATTGVGQMTITTGANTPGIGSFGTATAGFASEVGGRS
jgi:hypothetical protein